MITDVVQRWRGRRTSYRPAGEVIDPRRYEVAAIDSDAIARAFVEAHHYSATYPAARRRIGLYRGAQLVGVAVYSVPCQPRVLRALPCDAEAAVELGRLVLLDDVEAMGESWMIARAHDLLRRDGFEGVVSFSDPVPRRSAAGELVMPGHRGLIYQASNAVYTGRSTRRTLWLLPDGRVFSDRARQKIRTRERGWEYAVRQLVAAGAMPLRDAEDGAAWALRELRRVGRPFRHPGNHRYLFALDRACRRALPAHLEARGLRALPYPRAIDAEPIARAA